VITIVSVPNTGNKLAGNDGNEVNKVVKCNKHWIYPNSFSTRIYTRTNFKVTFEV